MENLERELQQFRFTSPPDWLKINAFNAAQNVVSREEARKRVQTMIWIAIAAGLVLAVIGHYVADTLTPALGPRHRTVAASSPLGPLPVGPSELFAAAEARKAAAVPKGPHKQLTVQDAEAPATTGTQGK